jgi:hypothetical protein
MPPTSAAGNLGAASRSAVNRANAQHSTGPRTEAGKQRSSLNALRHGLTAAHLVIGPEDRAEIEQMLAEFRDEIEPKGPLQHALFDQLVSAAWNLRRVRRMETELCAAAQSYRDLLDDEQLQKKLDRLSRHHTRLERSFHRALKELKAFHTDAALIPTLPASLVESSSPLASFHEIAKRTQHLTGMSNGVLAKRMFQAVDNEAEALSRAFTYQNRVAELEKQLASSSPIALAAAG